MLLNESVGLIQEILNQQLMLETAGTPKLDYLKAISTLSLTIDPSQKVMWGGKFVVKICFISHIANAALQIHEKYQKATRIVIFCENEEKPLIQQLKDPGMANQLAIYKKLFFAGGIPEHSHTDLGVPSDPTWSFKGPTHYIEQETVTYSLLRDIICNNAYDTLIKQAKAPAKVRVLALGCGEGHELKLIRDKLFNNDVKEVELWGIDIHQPSISLCHKKFRHGHFFCGDMKEIQKLMAQVPQDDTPLIVIASGSLTRHVQNGTYEVLKIIQKINNCCKPDVFVIGGYTQPLVNSETIGYAGFECEINRTYCDPNPGNTLHSYKNVYVLTQKSIDNEIQDILIRSKQRSSKEEITVLDLSFSSDPVTLMRLIIEKHENTDKLSSVNQIDLSWSALDEKQIDALLELCARIPSIQYVTVSSLEPFHARLLDKISSGNKYTLLRRLDCQSEFEYPHLSPVLAKNLGLYNKLPNEILFKPTVRKSPSL